MKAAQYPFVPARGARSVPLRSDYLLGSPPDQLSRHGRTCPALSLETNRLAAAPLPSRPRTYATCESRYMQSLSDAAAPHNCGQSAVRLVPGSAPSPAHVGEKASAEEAMSATSDT